MPEIVGVRFKPCGKIYDFEVNGIDLHKGDLVVVESELGLNIGSVVKERCFVEINEKELKKIIRKATEEDLHQKQKNKALEKEALLNCLERIMARGLPMKLISTEATLDRKRIIFYFTADRRIDFRELVKDLAAKFKTRIEMRQIGVRDGAKIIGSLGICGRELCCTKFLTSFEPISIKMAKKQELALNTGKLSGACGRLMCCLGFEFSETYERYMNDDTAILTEDSSIVQSDDTDVCEVVATSVELFEEAIVPPPPSQIIPQKSEKAEKPRKHRTFKRRKKRRKKKPTRQ